MFRINHFVAIILTVFSMTSIDTAVADTIINNYSSQPQPAQTPAPANSNSGCNQGANNNTDSGMPAGVYTTPNGNGGTNTLYTTGDKKPFIVDSNCNNTSGIQPYVEYNLPGSGATGSASSSTGSIAPASTPPVPAPLRR